MSLSDGATQYVPLDKLKIYQDSILVNFHLRKLNFSNRFNIIENPGADTVDIDVGDEIQNLADLIDVAITQPVEKHVLRYSGTQWENKQLKITDLEDVQVTSPLQGNSLRHDGTRWVNAFPFLDDLIDVVISNPISNHVLKHNGISWVNALPLLNDNSDISLTSPTTGDLIRFNGTHWVNVVASAINLAINDLTDVIITSAQTNQFVRFDGSNWVNTLISLNNLTDVVLGSLQTGQFIQYNGTNWINTLAILDTFTDVIITSPVNGQILQYNGTHWVNASPTPGVVGLNDLSDVVLNATSVGDILRYNGSNFVNVAIAELLNITQLLDVNITSPVNGEVLQYNGALWVNGTVAAGGANQLNDLTDVTINTPLDNQALIYDNSTSQWRNEGLPSAPVNLDDLNDVIITTPATGHILRHNGSAFVNVLLAELITLTQLSDVAITSPTTNQQLVYNGTTWANQTVAQASSVSFLPDTVNNGSNWGIWSGGARAGTGLFAGAQIESGSVSTRQDSSTSGKVATSFVTGSSDDDIAGFRGGTPTQAGLYARRDQNFHWKCRIQVPNIATIRFGIGFTSQNTFPGGSDTWLPTSTPGFLFFYSSTVTTNLTLLRNDNSGTAVSVNSGVPVQADTPIVIEIVADAPNSRIGWALNEGSFTYYTTDIPSATTSLNYGVRVEAKTGGARELIQYYAYLTQDPV